VITDKGTIVGTGAKRDISKLQQKLADALGLIVAKAKGQHAEVKVMEKAEELGAKMRGLAASRKICKECEKQIEARGGKLTSDKTATFGD
jgi:hypothetical protein